MPMAATACSSRSASTPLPGWLTRTRPRCWRRPTPSGSPISAPRPSAGCGVATNGCGSIGWTESTGTCGPRSPGGSSGPSTGPAAQLFADTWLYWALRGHAGEGLVALDRILAGDPGGLADQHRAHALVALAGLRYATGDVAGTCEAGADAVASARSGARDELLGEALLLAASGAAFAGDMTTAADLLDLTASPRD